MLFIRIYILFCLLICLIFEIKFYKAIRQYNRKYIHNIEVKKNREKTKFLKKFIYEHIKIWFLCFVPILNLLIFISILINGVKIQENSDCKEVL